MLAVLSNGGYVLLCKQLLITTLFPFAAGQIYHLLPRDQHTEFHAVLAFCPDTMLIRYWTLHTAPLPTLQHLSYGSVRAQQWYRLTTIWQGEHEMDGYVDMPSYTSQLAQPTSTPLHSNINAFVHDIIAAACHWNYLFKVEKTFLLISSSNRTHQLLQGDHQLLQVDHLVHGITYAANPYFVSMSVSQPAHWRIRIHCRIYCACSGSSYRTLSLPAATLLQQSPPSPTREQLGACM